VFGETYRFPGSSGRGPSKAGLDVSRKVERRLVWFALGSNEDGMLAYADRPRGSVFSLDGLWKRRGDSAPADASQYMLMFRGERQGVPEAAESSVKPPPGLKTTLSIGECVAVWIIEV
jgi:hypothetical protein